MAACVRMPSLAEMPPPAWDLAYLVDAAGGLDNAARLVGTTPNTLAGWLTGQPTALLVLATRRLAAALPGRLGWTHTTDPHAGPHTEPDGAGRLHLRAVA